MSCERDIQLLQPQFRIVSWLEPPIPCTISRSTDTELSEWSTRHNERISLLNQYCTQMRKRYPLLFCTLPETIRPSPPNCMAFPFLPLPLCTARNPHHRRQLSINSYRGFVSGFSADTTRFFQLTQHALQPLEACSRRGTRTAQNVALQSVFHSALLPVISCSLRH